MFRPFLLHRLLLVSLTLSIGCAGTFEMIGAGLDYESADLPDEQIVLDLAYRDDPEADPIKHRADLFLPSTTETGWPTLIFVHGGGWTSGDRAIGALGLEPMRNVGRFYAARGYGVVSPSYRLQPGVTWREQVADVADLVVWARAEVARRGGNPNRIFLGGHSAGAWLAARVGLEKAPLSERAVSREMLCGLVLVSGAAYDIEDEETYALGAKREYFVKRFGGDSPDWAREASVAANVDGPIPPALLLAAEGEPPTFHRQASQLEAALKAANGASKKVKVPGQNHQRILIGMSRVGDPVSAAALEFMNAQDCPATR